MGNGWTVFGLCCVLVTTGCYVNRAVIDPWGYAPCGPPREWQPDERADELSCEPTSQEAEVPDADLPLSLGEILDIALVNNPQTQESWARAREAAALYGQSQSTAFPTLSVEFAFTHSRTAYLTSQVEQQQNITKEKLLVNNQSEWGPQAHLTYTLFDFGQRRYTSEAARYSLYFADFSHNRTLQTLLETVTLNFYNYLYELKQLEANEADLVNTQETLNAAQLALKKGVKSISDVLQARSQMLVTEIKLSQQRRVVNTSYTTLLTDMGLPANTDITTLRLPIVDPNLDGIACLDDYLSMALDLRPDLLAARAGVRSAENSLTAAKRQWTPVLDYSLDIGRTYFSGGFHDDYDFTSTFSVSMPLFTGFHIRNTVRQNEAKVELACAQLKEIELEVIKDVSTAHYNVGIAYETLIAANAFLVATKEEYKVARAQYEAGVNTILDLISAQSSLFDARAKEADATKEWFTSLAQLTYSVGSMCHIPKETPINSCPPSSDECRPKSRFRMPQTVSSLQNIPNEFSSRNSPRIRKTADIQCFPKDFL